MALSFKVSPLNPRSYAFSYCRRCSLTHVDCGCCRVMQISLACSLWRTSNSDQLRLQLSCRISQRRSDLVVDRQLHSRPQMRRWRRSPSPGFSKKASFCFSSRDRNVVEEEFLDRSDGAEPGAEKNSGSDFLLSEVDRSSKTFDKHFTLNNAGDEHVSAVSEAESTDGLETAATDVDRISGLQVHGAWFQKRFQKLVRPMIRVLSGANLNKPMNIAARTTHKEDTASWSLPRMLTGSLPPGYYRRRIGEKLRQAEADFFIFASQLGKFLFIMMATGAILATGFQLAGGDSQEETILWLSWLAGIITGSMIGAEKVMQQRCRSGPRNVVITGSTRGLGKALAREFLFAGDSVVIASRSSDSVAKTVKELQDEANLRIFHPFLTTSSSGEDFQSRRDEKLRAKVIGMACDVSKVDDVRHLAEFAVHKLGSVDIWINNAGVNKGFRPLVQFSDADIQQIVSANLIGSLICTREAIQMMMSQPKGGHVFNMDGAGSGGSSTPLTAVYGSTKCGLRQLHGTLLKEYRHSRVGIHTASPGMVLTDLLLSGASLQNKKMFNIICELPETVARSLVPRMRVVKGSGKAINFLTPPRILLALITAWLRRGRWFDEEGRAVYAAEADRVRNWAEGRTRLPVSAAIDQFSDTTWVSVFSITVICAFIMLSTSGNGMPGT